MSENDKTNEPLSKTAWKAALKGFTDKVKAAMGDVLRLEVSTAQAALKVGAILADAQDGFRRQGEGDDFAKWAQDQTGKSGSWVASRIQAARVVKTLPAGRVETPIEDLAALSRVGSHEEREAILSKVRDSDKMTGAAATKAIRAAADAYLMEKNPDRATKKAERAKTRDEEKAAKMRDAMRPKVARIVKRATENGIPMEDLKAILFAGVEIGESFGAGAKAACSAIFSETPSDAVPSDETEKVLDEILQPVAA